MRPRDHSRERHPPRGGSSSAPRARALRSAAPARRFPRRPRREAHRSASQRGAADEEGDCVERGEGCEVRSRDPHVPRKDGRDVLPGLPVQCRARGSREGPVPGLPEGVQVRVRGCRVSQWGHVPGGRCVQGVHGRQGGTDGCVPGGSHHRGPEGEGARSRRAGGAAVQGVPRARPRARPRPPPPPPRRPRSPVGSADPPPQDPDCTRTDTRSAQGYKVKTAGISMPASSVGTVGYPTSEKIQSLCLHVAEML